MAQTDRKRDLEEKLTRLFDKHVQPGNRCTTSPW